MLKTIENHCVVQYIGETQYIKQEGVKKNPQIFLVTKEETRYELVCFTHSPKYKPGVQTNAC